MAMLSAGEEDSCINGDWRGWKKVVKSAVVIIPPAHAWQQIQDIRCKHDKAYSRWMPHINLVYPFVEDSVDGQSFGDAEAALKPVLTSIQPFTVHFDKNSFRYFHHKKNCTLWLKPQTVSSANGVSLAPLDDYGDMHDAILVLQQKLLELFPNCNDLSSFESRGFTPHLSLGQFRPHEIQKFVGEFRAKWNCISFEVNEIHLISRQGFDDPFCVRKTVALGRFSGIEAVTSTLSTTTTAADDDDDDDTESDGVVARRKWEKVYDSAFVIIPPQHCWQQIQDIRSKHDQDYNLWMPHIGLIHPFIEDSAEGRSFDDVESTLNSALINIQPFTIHIDKNSFRCFSCGNESTLWLKPQSALSAAALTPSLDDHFDKHQSLIRLQERLRSKFPACKDFSSAYGQRGFCPHLQLGQFRAEEIQPFVDELMTRWKNIAFEVGEIHIVSRRESDAPFSIRKTLKLY